MQHNENPVQSRILH